MSSLSTLPKGDSAWLLRKSIQRVMQQVSVLETNIGSSTTGNSANTQIIFNDAGTLRGDSDLIFNTTLNRLVATNLESTAALLVGTSATITGDLTLSAGTVNGVGYLNASKVLTAGSALIFDGTNLGIGGTGQLRFATSGGGIGDNSIGTENSFSMMLRCGRGSTSNIELASDKLVFSTGASERYRIASDGVATWSNVGGVAGTAMTLNSTGLGVGVASPTHKLTVSATAGATAIFTSSGAATAVTIDNTNANAWGGNLAIATNGVNAGFLGTIGSLVGSTSQNIAIWSTSGNGIVFHTNGNSTARAIIDSSGNVGVGVTPAGTGGCLQLKSGITFPATQVASSDANTLDDYEEGTFTPIVRGSTTSGTGTYGNQVGYYTKVGRLVTCNVWLQWTAHTGTGFLQFGGLPFNSANTTGNYSGCSIGYQSQITSSANTVIYLLQELNSNIISVTATPVAGGTYGLVSMDNAGEIAFTVSYYV
jgi:hypothetical protein